MQFVFAGKAHPKDEAGKNFIQEVYKFSREPEFESRIVFVEDYDTYVGRRLYQGVDLWLNNPLPPAGSERHQRHEAAAEWRPESQRARWLVGARLTTARTAGPSARRSTTRSTRSERRIRERGRFASLFHMLETQIIPLFYAKPDGRLPLAWLQLMRESIRSVMPVFNTHRMVREYNERLYEPAGGKHRELLGEERRKGHRASAMEGAHPPGLAADPHHRREDRPTTRLNILGGRFADRDGDGCTSARFRPGIRERAGLLRRDGEQEHPRSRDGRSELERKPRRTRRWRAAPTFTSGTIPAAESGSYGLNVRVIPTNPNLTQAHELRLITWAR